MTDRWNYLGAALVSVTAICALLLIAIAWSAGTGPVNEDLLKVLCLAMCCGSVGTYAFVAGRYLMLRLERRPLLDRRVLTDDQFIAKLGSGRTADPEVVRYMRKTAASCFGGYGERFMPSDRLAEDLHLWDVAPWATEEFFAELEERFGEGDWPVADCQPVETFGDLVVAVSKMTSKVTSGGGK